eukprot:CAMPEP_0172917222 /NCGR_PEP_ID=MMETSP1075-20121228/197903_1 /TAXON_ID=2916 /ORGANISM="Ceratium fusus, Strain PA161109" /LENGTH=190 /DNA_ID=CAMNT_0013776655 /DNA_START=14 /DNA_END=583 /DNA_ORIENTATION=-
MTEEETNPAGEEESKADVGEETKAETKAETYDGVVSGKYQWDKEASTTKDADADMAGQAITKYSWSDGKKAVSIYVELPGLDDVPEDKISVTSGEQEASLTIEAIGTPPKTRSLVLKGLNNDIDGCKFTKKMGKNTVVLKLTKKEETAWYKLLESSGGRGGGDDDEEGGMGGTGGMGGMDMASMMGGMGG